MLLLFLGTHNFSRGVEEAPDPRADIVGETDAHLGIFHVTSPQIAGKSIVIYYMTREALSPSPFAFTSSGLTRLGPSTPTTYPIAKRIWDCFSEDIIRPVNISFLTIAIILSVGSLDYMILPLFIDAYNLNEVL